VVYLKQVLWADNHGPDRHRPFDRQIGCYLEQVAHRISHWAIKWSGNVTPTVTPNYLAARAALTGWATSWIATETAAARWQILPSAFQVKILLKILSF
jgi:hypothetical protein